MQRPFDILSYVLIVRRYTGTLKETNSSKSTTQWYHGGILRRTMTQYSAIPDASGHKIHCVESVVVTRTNSGMALSKDKRCPTLLHLFLAPLPQRLQLQHHRKTSTIARTTTSQHTIPRTF